MPVVEAVAVTRPARVESAKPVKVKTAVLGLSIERSPNRATVPATPLAFTGAPHLGLLVLSGLGLIVIGAGLTFGAAPIAARRRS